MTKRVGLPVDQPWRDYELALIMIRHDCSEAQAERVMRFHERMEARRND